MKRKERYIVRADEVTLTREGDYAVIQYKEADLPTTHLKLGPQVAQMSDAEIVECFNNTLRAHAQRAADYKHVAVEVPLRSPQIKYHADSDQWVPRAEVLRCLIEDDENGQLVVGVDDHELSLEEFGKLLTTRAGWGMRIEFVPDDQLHRRPVHEVREPRPDGEPRD